MEFENVSSQLRHSLTVPPEENVYSQRRKQCTIFNSRLEKFGRFKISGACAGKRPREKPGIPSVFDFLDHPSGMQMARGRRDRTESEC